MAWLAVVAVAIVFFFVVGICSGGEKEKEETDVLTETGEAFKKYSLNNKKKTNADCEHDDEKQPKPVPANKKTWADKPKSKLFG